MRRGALILALVLPPSLGAAAAAQTQASASDQTAPGWACEPLQRPAVPAVRDASWARQPFDAFVLQRLEAHGLTPAEPADPCALLRRVTYDLTGLPPTPEDVEAFAADPSDTAYARAVERLLASPQYGVHWARHWLDLVRYAETDGYERDRRKPMVHRYRDWVVEALNADMPYADFVTRQLAGDELPDPTVADLVATGYYRLGIWDDEPTDREQHRYDDLDSIADTTARAFLGISMGCARCHDHKRDPLAQREYYAFLAYFENLRPYELRARTVPVDGGHARFDAETRAVAAQRLALGERLGQRATARWQALDDPTRQHEQQAAAADLVATYSCDAAQAQVLHDDGGSRHGAVTGQAVPTDGHLGGALRFDGDDFVELPRLVQDSFTVSFWLRSDQAGDGSADDARWYTGTGLVDGEVDGVVADWGVAWHDDGRIVAGTGAPDTFVASPPGHADGRWHHVAFTRDRSTGAIALYVDGSEVATATGSQAALDAPPRLVVARRQTGGRGFRGDLDELRFYGRALTAAEVAALALDLAGGVRAPALLAAVAAAPDTESDGDANSADLDALRRLRRPQLETTEVLAAEENGPEPPASFVRLRGNVHAAGALVAPGVPAMVHGPAVPAAVAQARSSGRRSALAGWIVDPRNPLTWRVLANRLWQYHFGRGLVRSSNDFGRLGELPTHRDLLDWLAAETLARGGSLKAMHRLLVTSASYRMAATATPAALAADPQNDLFWRFDRRRLGAEEVRDSILAVTGALNLELGGPSVFPPLPAAVLATASRPEEAWGTSTPAAAARRSLFVHSKRSLQEPLLAVFDQADTDASCPVRFSTVQPTQALVLWNGEFARAQALALATRLAREAGDLPAQLELGLRLTTQRPARAADRDRLLQLAEDLQRDFGRDPAQALASCCLVLLNGNEFLYLD